MDTLKQMQLRTLNKKLALRLKTDSLKATEEQVDLREGVIEEMEEEKEEIFPFPQQDNSLVECADYFL